MSNAAVIVQRLRNRILSRPAIIGMAMLLVYALGGFFGAPWLVRQQLPKLVEQHLGAKATVDDVRINPFLFSIELRGLGITEPGGLPAFQAGSLLVDFETSSLLRWAWTFREIRIEKPVINADLDAAESLNLARLFAPKDGAPAKKQAPDSKPPRVLVQHFTIANGVFQFTDHTLQPAARAQFDPVNFEIHDISTLPDHDGTHKLIARLPGGGNLKWQGTMSLSPLDTSGSIELKDGKLATPWRFVQDHLTIAEPAGAFGFSLNYRMGYQTGALDLQLGDIAFHLNEAVIAQQKGSAPMGRLSAVTLEGGRFDLRKRTLEFKEARIGDGAVGLILDETGKADWSRLVRASGGAQATAKPEAPAEAKAGHDAAPWQISLPKISVGPLALAVTDHSRMKPLRIGIARVEAALGLNITVGKETQIGIDDGNLKLADLDIRSGDDKAPLLAVSGAELGGASLDLLKKTAGAAVLKLNGGKTLITREADGTLNLARAFAVRREEPAKDSGFKFALERAEIAGHSVSFADHGFQPALAYDLEQVRAAANKIAVPFKGAIPVELGLRVRQGGTLQAKGTVNLQQPSADIRAELTELALAPLETVIKRHTTLTLASGKAGAAGRITWDGKKGPAAVRYTGNAAITGFDIKTATSSERLFSWQRLAASDIDFDAAENRLVIAQLNLVQPYAKLVVYKDRSTNLATIKRADAAPEPKAAPAPAASPAATPPAPMAVNIDRISVERGNMDFSDLSLILPFSTYIKSLGGSVSGLSSAPESRASLKFEGRIEEYGLARAEGAIQPFAPKKFTDIAVAFRNVELTPLSPYTATFAGRKIASGKLSLDLQYKLDNSKLAGENKLLLEKFTLGERVDSPSAVNLPLDLAIALLTDSDGRIDLAVPVSGDVDHPEFSYGHVVWQAIRTVITRIVTAPFRALGALFGSGSETLGDIMFDPGSSRILPTEYEKVRRIADGLQKRPQLKLMVQGLYHKDEDSRALRAQAVRADLAVREGLKLVPGEDPGPVGFDNAKTQRALETMLDARSGSSAAAQFAEAFRKTSGRDAARVNAALALVGRGAGDRELYIAMHQRLVELQPLSADALVALAKARGDAILRAFTVRLKFDPARLGSKPADATDEAGKSGVPIKLSFEPMAP